MCLFYPLIAHEVAMLHVIARIKLIKTEEGGRTSWVRSGYRPNIRFGDLYTNGARQTRDRSARGVSLSDGML